MGLLVKTLVAFCIGIGAIYAAQTLWLSSVEKEILANRGPVLPQVQFKPVAQIDARKLTQSLYPKIDPNIGKDAWRGTLNRQVSESINAGRLVPLPPRTNVPGVPRF